MTSEHRIPALNVELELFVKRVAALQLFKETLDQDEDPESAEMSLDYLICDHDTLESLIIEARNLC
jgi:hypothetical protein